MDLTRETKAIWPLLPELRIPIGLVSILSLSLWWGDMIKTSMMLVVSCKVGFQLKITLALTTRTKAM